MNNEKLLFFVEEEHRNLQHLIRAMTELTEYFPLDETFFTKITDKQVDILDRFIFRFTKTVDSMGKRLFPEILTVTGERDEDMFFRDILNRLERMGILTSVEDWNTFRERRNSLTHEYPETYVDKAAMLTDAYEKSFELIQLFERVKELLAQRVGISMEPYPTLDISMLPYAIS
jgi:hypothetical protein